MRCQSVAMRIGLAITKYIFGRKITRNMLHTGEVRCLLVSYDVLMSNGVASTCLWILCAHFADENCCQWGFAAWSLYKSIITYLLHLTACNSIIDIELPLRCVRCPQGFWHPAWTLCITIHLRPRSVFEMCGQEFVKWTAMGNKASASGVERDLWVGGCTDLRTNLFAWTSTYKHSCLATLCVWVMQCSQIPALFVMYL